MMCYATKYNDHDENVRKTILSDKKAIEIALLSEIPMNTPLSIIEIASHIWNIQSREYYISKPATITKIRRVLHDIILENPRKIIETDIDEYVIKSV